jgi:hypothetical protein
MNRTSLHRALVRAAALALVAALALLAVGAPLPRAAAAPASSTADWTQVAELLAADPGEEDGFGYSVAISGDTLVVGAPWHSDGTGAVYVFERSGSIWAQQAMLTIQNGAWDDRFGYAVAIAGDTIVAGSPGHVAQGSTHAGTAYVFVRSGASWAQQAELWAGDGGWFDWFGGSVAIDGDTIVVGAPMHRVESWAMAGAAYVFVRSGGGWAQQAELSASDGGPGAQLGTSVAIDGDTVVAGAPEYHAGHVDGVGAAWVFVRSGSSWEQKARLDPSDGAEWDGFGRSVAVTGDTIVAGAPGHEVSETPYAGAVYVFTPSGNSWAQQAELSAGASLGNAFWLGWSVAISGDTIVAGAPWSSLDEEADDTGSAFVFVRGESGWAQQQRLATGGVEYEFAWAVAIAGGTIVAGAPNHQVGTIPWAGAAYVFERPAPPAPLCERADVAAVIYGAWEGTPVRAWVGGTEQPTLYTAHDAFGRQAVLWTFYPPASTSWTVRVEPQLPPGLESPRWQYRLVWIEPAPPGFQPGQAAGRAVTIRSCSGTVLHFQLVDTGAE